jgi:hypothetical protein
MINGPWTTTHALVEGGGQTSLLASLSRFVEVTLDQGR